ncbi:zinc ribbon domain-containing protein [Natrinema versiforme]|uniref:Zinc-ribbon domain-containing protein n=1 Tax=Natrinema versiforme JCM 10478 TaxID=1227496 RepID=L9Y6G6_9EURY|nr:hypothetical protein [Natrinema versiforme]ELY69322.1 hypothetical protein C489_05193 [Natrinema versiforme JCM 10478]
MSYDQECSDCGSTMTAAANYCPFCGEPTVETSGDNPSNEPTKWDEWTLLELEWDCITRRAKARFMEEWEKREDWKNFESRYHVYKAQDQLSVASYHSRQNDSGELTKTNIADAVNHMLMAMATLEVDNEECQPITSEGELLRRRGISANGGPPERS